MQVLQRQVVTGVETKTNAPCLFGGSDEGCYGSLAVFRIARGVRLGVEFHAVGTASLGSLHLAWVSVDKDAGANARSLECAADVSEECTVLQRVPSVVRGDLVVAVRYQRHLCRLDL